MCEGEFESMKALNSVISTIAPQPWAWGKCKNEESYFMIVDFREVGEQPPEPIKFTAQLAELHKKSVSPTGKFGFNFPHHNLPRHHHPDHRCVGGLLGEPFVFDAGSFYGHNEYDVGNWRAPRLSLVYMRHYKRNFAVSEPEDDWDGRNLLYSLRFNIGTAILIPGCNQREVVFEDMKELCRTYCPDDWRNFTQGLREDGEEEEVV
ncbi:hypothetical protein Egran_06556 [Elaphomyces granulatus]|uniref:Protein-ribulosamine 3-kinase n=1 Tax=Elaphomyces granulatus TaxID=519963 RepID=A0A232LPE2_9EURO|nr:hypothetical protein Egran_06556 [Elaphomyces granulatus]